MVFRICADAVCGRPAGAAVRRGHNAMQFNFLLPSHAFVPQPIQSLVRTGYPPVV